MSGAASPGGGRAATSARRYGTLWPAATLFRAIRSPSEADTVATTVRAGHAGRAAVGFVSYARAMRVLGLLVAGIVGAGCGPGEPVDSAAKGEPGDTARDTDPGTDTGCVPTDEVCDGLDNDCDGDLTDEPGYRAWYRDADGDGYGDEGVVVYACAALDGYTSGRGDCNDADPEISPGVSEQCNGVDDDCDGVVANGDEDGDGDGWPRCMDCDETDPDIYDGAPEHCDGVDRDCDGVVSLNDDDGDGQTACDGDCDDADPTRWLGAPEACDGVDNDCDGGVPADEGIDADGDGALLCGDCDDADPTRSSRHVDTCGDGVDDDCDGVVDGDCVDCDLAVPNDYTTIQAAIDAATTADLICVGSGTWAENVDFGGAEVTVWAVKGAAATIIDGGALNSVVRFTTGEGPGAALRGFTLTNGYETYAGGGVRIEGASPTLEDLVVRGNDGGYYGGGVYVDEGAPTLTRVAVRDNSAYHYWEWERGAGGGVYLRDADAILDDVIVEGNIAGEYGGGLCLYDSDAVLTNLTIRENSGVLMGAGIAAWGGAPRLSNVRVLDNATPTFWGFGDIDSRGGGAYLSADARLTNVLVAGNSDVLGAGGLFIDAGYEPVLTNVIVTDNSSGLYAEAGAAPILSYSNVWGNGTADYTGMDDPTGTDGNVSVDPVLLGGGQLDASSPLLDAGDPSLTDPDGSRSDIGAFGGAGASSWDADGDGFPAWWLPGSYDAATSPGADCDDDDATVYPASGC